MEQKIILLADDDRDDTEMFCEAIAEIDRSTVCHCAINGEELLNKLNVLDKKPNLIFLDVNMPIMNGWECLKSLKEDERYKEIPVIMISTSSHKEDIDSAITKGALCYFVKPNTYNELKEVLQTIIANLSIGLNDSISNLRTNKSANIFTFIKNT